MADLKFDKIKVWSEIKLQIIEKYAAAYSKILSKQRSLKHYYVDAFSGAGVHKNQAGQSVDGSPVRVLDVEPAFDGYYFIELDGKKAKFLRERCENKSNIKIFEGDCNKILPNKVLPNIKYERFTRALVLLDPYGLHLNWEIMKTCGQSKAVDMFLNFPVMDMNRNAIWRVPEEAPAKGLARMDAFWGNSSWKGAAYTDSSQGSLLTPDPKEKTENEDIVEAFKKRLKTEAGFKNVVEPLPMKNSNNAVVYYLFFASQNTTANDIIEDIFRSYRNS